jgi:hypothetical protein
MSLYNDPRFSVSNFTRPTYRAGHSQIGSIASDDVVSKDDRFRPLPASPITVCLLCGDEETTSRTPLHHPQ